MKYLRKFENKIIIPDYLLCVYSDVTDFTVGKKYEVIEIYEHDSNYDENKYHLIANNLIEHDKDYNFKLIDDKKNDRILELSISSKLGFNDELTNIFETIVFTKDNSYEEYIIRKKSEKYNL